PGRSSVQRRIGSRPIGLTRSDSCRRVEIDGLGAGRLLSEEEEALRPGRAIARALAGRHSRTLVPRSAPYWRRKLIQIPHALAFLRFAGAEPGDSRGVTAHSACVQKRSGFPQVPIGAMSPNWGGTGMRRVASACFLLLSSTFAATLSAADGRTLTASPQTLR